MKSLSLFFGSFTWAKQILLLLTPVLSLILSMKGALIGLALLIVVDLLTGIKKTLSKKNVPFNLFKSVFWLSIKSFLLRQTWKKTYQYLFGIIGFVILESLITGTVPVTLLSKTLSLSEIAVITCAIVEVWSINENIRETSGRNLLKVLMPLLPQKLQDLLNRLHEKS